MLQMSHHGYNPHHHSQQIVVHDHDVLSGRGVNIAHHPGNQRFRTLVTTRTDETYCASYSASEKRAVAEEIVRHIKDLKPPGRFLKREGRGQVSRGLQGPWEELTDKEVIKKTCQALRDCNRLDRQGYANGVAMPTDVVQSAQKRSELGLTGKQQAARAAAEAAAAQAAATIPESTTASSKRDWGRISPSVENAAEWLKKQRTDDSNAPAIATPSTSGSETIINNAGPNIPQVPYDTVTYDPLTAPHPQYTSEHTAHPYQIIGASAYPPSTPAPNDTYKFVSTTAGSYAHHGLPREYPMAGEGPVSFVSSSSNEAYSPTTSAPPRGSYHSLSTTDPFAQSSQASGAGTSECPLPAAVYPSSPAPPYAIAPTHSSTSASIPFSNGTPEYQAEAPVYQQHYSTAPGSSSYVASPAQGRTDSSSDTGQAQTIPAPSPIFGSASPVTTYGAAVQSSIPYQSIQGTVPSYQPTEPKQHVEHPRRMEQTSMATSQSSSFSRVRGDSPVPHHGARLHSPAAAVFPGAQPSSLTATPHEPIEQPDRGVPPSSIEHGTASSVAKYITASTQISGPSYEQEDLNAQSAGADLLITAANQTMAAPSNARAEAVVTAAKWEGETLGL